MGVDKSNFQHSVEIWLKKRLQEELNPWFSSTMVSLNSPLPLQIFFAGATTPLAPSGYVPVCMCNSSGPNTREL